MAPISYYCLRCISAFDQLITTLNNPASDYGNQLPLKGVINEYGRFKVLVGSLGAKHPPERRISLDYRLRDAEFYKIRIAEILERLERVLQKG